MIRKILGRLGCSLATLALALPASAGGRQGGALQFEELAREWFEIHVAATAPAEPRRVDLDAILAKHLAHVRLGAFEILVPPASLVDPKMQDEIAATLQALFSVQEQWLEWTSGDEPLSADVRGTLKTVESWLKAWKHELPSDARALAGVELFTMLEPKDDVRAALQDFSGLLSRGGGLELSGARAARLILMPSRRDFIGFVSLLGWKLERWRGSYWCDGLRSWTEFDYAGTLILALEFAAPGGGDPFRGLAMTAKNPRGLEQHVAQLGTIALLDAYFGERMEPVLVAGIANSIVIECWGEVDTRTDGDLRARQKLGRSVFVPGGNSEGGTLAPQNANSRWRDGQGGDHFVKALREAQQSGAKESKTRKGPAGFLLLSDDESERTVVHGPFLLGEGPETPPAAFGGDHAEFQRAYCTGFVYWLRERAEGSSQKSRARFALFLRMLAAAPLPEAFASAYEAPLSTAEMDDSSLEGRFLLWLRKR